MWCASFFSRHPFQTFKRYIFFARLIFLCKNLRKPNWPKNIFLKWFKQGKLWYIVNLCVPKFKFCAIFYKIVRNCTVAELHLLETLVLLWTYNGSVVLFVIFGIYNIPLRIVSPRSLQGSIKKYIYLSLTKQ